MFKRRKKIPEIYIEMALTFDNDFDVNTITRELVERRGRDNALAALLVTFAHELTHYFQWINGRTLDDDAREKEALRCAGRVLADYAEDCNRP